jgi:hypothetical protein
VGVKFATWGKNFDRFYTGSSDGIVKAWDIRALPGQEFVREVIRLSGGISTGKFSPDFSKLILGDSTGKVHYLAIGKDELSEERLPAIRRPIRPHAPLPPPLIDDDDVEIPPELTAQERAQQFLDCKQIVLHDDGYVGAVQGPNYINTGLFYDVEKYKDENGKDDIGWSKKELREKQERRYDIDRIRLSRLPEVQSSSRHLHRKNITLDIDVATLPFETLARLKEEQVDLSFSDEYDFVFEPGPRLDVDKAEKSSSKQLELLSMLFFVYSYQNRLLLTRILDNVEIQKLYILEKQIYQELRIQKLLKDLF